MIRFSSLTVSELCEQGEEKGGRGERWVYVAIPCDQSESCPEAPAGANRLGGTSSLYQPAPDAQHGVRTRSLRLVGDYEYVMKPRLSRCHPVGCPGQDRAT
eukprot:1194870-Prorocentrum_minimum.AAC.1